MTFGADTLASTDGADLFVVAFDPENGEPRLARSYAGIGDQRLEGAAVRSDGSLVLGGSFAGQFDLAGALLSSAGEVDVFLAVLAL